VNAYENRIRAEVLPDDPPIPLEEAISGGRNIPAFVDLTAWNVWNADDSAVIASGGVSFLNTPEPVFRTLGIEYRSGK
jgi:hypothetical protein